jgi:hypothetical protein
MSVSSVSHRPAPPPVQRQPEREPVKAAAKEAQPKPKVEAHAQHAQPTQQTYSHAKEKPAAPAKGQRVDVQA